MASRSPSPRATGEGSIGTTLLRWATAFINAITCTTINALTLAAAAVGFTISGGTTSKTLTVTQNTALDEAVAMSSKATATAWADYFASSTIIGWAASPTGKIMYKKIGSMVFIKFYITGTSNANATSFTLPYTIYNDFNCFLPSGYGVNNSVALTSPGTINLISNQALVVLYPTLDTSAAWATSNTKTMYGEFFYEVA